MKQGWEYKKFEDCICKVPKAKQVQTTAYNEGTRYPIISQEEKLISGYCDDESMLFHIDKPVVIFGDHTRVLKYIDFDFIVGADGVKILEPKDFMGAKFLLYYLKWYNIPSLGYSRHYKLLKEIDIPLPPLEVQQSIVSELDLINELIAKKKAQLADLDSLAQSLFYEMFGDPVENEKGWEVKNLKEITSKIGSGATPKGGNESYKESGVSLIRSLNVHNNQFIYDDLAHIDEEQASALSNVTIQKDDVLLNITGASVARCCIVPSDILPARVNQHVCIVRLKNEYAISRFICSLFTNHSYQIKLLALSRSKAATREALPKSLVDNLEIALPPLSLQQAFATRYEVIEEEKRKIQSSLQDLETLLASRMQFYFD